MALPRPLSLFAFAFVLLTLSACGGGGGAVKDGTLELPYSAIEPLRDFTLTTVLQVTAQGESYHLAFDGAFQQPDRLQGRLRLRGRLQQQARELGRPPDMEVTIIGQQAWWRQPGTQWQRGIESGDSVDPLVTLRQYATPWFYLDALHFDELRLPVAGEEDDVNGEHAYVVRLDKAAVIEVMRQGTEISVYPDEVEHNEVFPGLIENAQQVLPADFAVSLWVARDGLRPLRIAFDYSITEQDLETLSFGFPTPLQLHLQMDIIATEAPPVDIVPPET
jgi:hypothetical protein